MKTVSPFKNINIAKIFFLLFLFSLFFPTKYLFPTISSYQTGQFSDLTSINLYLCDIFILISFIFIIPRGENHVIFPIWILKNVEVLTFFLLFISIFEHQSFQIYYLIKLIELSIVAYGTSFVLFNDSNFRKLALIVFILLASLEGIISLSQFIFQKSFGLRYLGEQMLSPQILGIAKIVSGGTVLIRGYGTFPHPNVLAAFLVAGVIFTLYLLAEYSSTWQRNAFATALFIQIMGLTTTFSRAAFLSAGLGSLMFFLIACFFLPKDFIYRQTKKLIFPFLVLIFSAIVSFFIFRPYLLTRITFNDTASIERGFYNHIATNMIHSHPFIGVGIGESMLHMQQYTTVKLWPWQIQPIHNYFLLAAAELGIPGALILIWFIISHLAKMIQIITQQINTPGLYQIAIAIVLFSFIILMFFDHYFYTLEQTQLLLWVILGAISVEIKNTYAK